VDHANHDKKFLATFLTVLAVLVGLAFLIAIAASIVDFSATNESMDPAAMARLEDRVKPVAMVVTDPAALMQKTEASSRAPMSGEEIVGKVCGACHQAGVLGAPKIGEAAAWKARIDAQGGVDAIVEGAINGINQMPARGGDPSLSDEEVQEAVEYMLGQSGL